MPSITRRFGNSRDERRDEVRARLLAAVEGLVARDESLATISIDRLASEASIARSTFYMHFRDKADLLGAAIRMIVSELDRVYELWWNLRRDFTYADLRVTLATIQATYRPHLRLLAAAFDAAAYDPLMREHVTAMVDHYTACLAEHIARGQREGWISPGMPANETAAWIFWMAERGQHKMLVSASAEEFARQTDALAQLVWNALYASAPDPPST